MSIAFIRCQKYFKGDLHESHAHSIVNDNGDTQAKGICPGLDPKVDHIWYVTGTTPICVRPLVEEPQYHVRIGYEFDVMCRACQELSASWIYKRTLTDTE